MPAAYSSAFRLTPNCPVRWRRPDGAIARGRFVRPLTDRPGRALVAFEAGVDGAARTRTVNIAHLELAPEVVRRQCQDRRRQAVATYPFLAFILTPHDEETVGAARAVRVWSPTSWTLAARQAIRRTVDDARPLRPLLLEVLQTSPWRLRHVARHAAVFGAAFQGRLDAALAALAWVTPETAPCTARRVTALHCLVQRFAPLFGTPNREHRRGIAHLLSDDARLAPLVHYEEFVRALIGWVEAQDRPVSLAAAHALLGFTSIEAWSRAADRWAQLTQTGGPNELGLSGTELGGVPLTWATLFTESVQHGGLTFECLDSPAALVAEAARMSNCLAHYARFGLSGKYQILRVRRDETSLASVLLLRSGTHEWKLVQAAGPRNTLLPQDVQSALAEFEAALPDYTARWLQRPDLAEAVRRARQIEDVLRWPAHGPYVDVRRHFLTRAALFGSAAVLHYREALGNNAAAAAFFSRMQTRCHAIHSRTGSPEVLHKIAKLSRTDFTLFEQVLELQLRGHGK